jgi:ribosomal protein L16 Arg81 hydroxylase
LDAISSPDPEEVTKRQEKMPGNELRDLLAPMSPEIFLSEYWQRRPLHIKGEPEKFLGLFDLPRFYSAIQRASELAEPRGYRLSVLVKDAQKSLTFSEDISPADVAECLNRGLTICANNINLGDDKLTYFTAAIREQLCYLGEARFNCYLSPDNSGADTHFDARVATTLQIEGKKRWRFSPAPALAWPLSNAQVRQGGHPYWMLPWTDSLDWARLEKVDESGFMEVVLEPGDLLCLPAGTWHNAKAIGSSLALNLIFSPLNFFTFLTNLIEPAFLSKAEWRSGPPPFVAENVSSADLPSTIKQYLTQRLSELSTFINTIEHDETHMNKIWRDLAGLEN